jgi:hypothetical protein
MVLTYFTLAELRAMPDIGDVGKHSDERLIAAGEWAESTIERTVRTSFVARSKVETLDGDRQDCEGRLSLSSRFVLGVTAVTSNGVEFDAGQLAEVKVTGRRIYRRTVDTYSGSIAWDTGVQNIVVTYNSGYSTTPPGDIKDAALQAARYRVLRTAAKAGISDRATALTNELGNVQLSTAAPDRPTGLPDVDVVLIQWRRHIGRRFVVV